MSKFQDFLRRQVVILDPKQAADQCARHHRGQTVPLAQVAAELAGMTLGVEDTWAALQEMITVSPSPGDPVSLRHTYEGTQPLDAYLLVNEGMGMVSVSNGPVPTGEHRPIAGEYRPRWTPHDMEAELVQEPPEAVIHRGRHQILAALEAEITDPTALDRKLSDREQFIGTIQNIQRGIRVLTPEQVMDVRERVVARARLRVDNFFQQVYGAVSVSGPPFDDLQTRKVALARDREIGRRGFALGGTGRTKDAGLGY